MTISSLALGRFSRLALRSHDIWQGGLVRMPTWVENPVDKDLQPIRPLGALWVSLRTGLIHLEFANDDQSTNAVSPDLVLTALINFGLKEARRLEGRPAVVQVRDAEQHRRRDGAVARQARQAGAGAVARLRRRVCAAGGSRGHT